MADTANLNTGFGASAAPPSAAAAPAPPPPDRSLPERMRTMREKMEEEEKGKNRFVAFLTSRRFGNIAVVAVIVWLCFEIPHLMWVRTPEIPLKIVVVDKTVPFSERREHRALFWLLLQSKFVKPGMSGENDRFYDFQHDYVGAHPTSKNGQDRTTDLLTPEALKGADILYFADTYGVYRADYTQFNEPDIAATEHSEKIFGGLEESEVAAAEAFAAGGGTLIGEFSTFASPTPTGLRERMEAVMGVSWTGWVGRYFADFQDEKDVPKWLYDLYQKQTGHAWDIEGSGYMLCKDEEENFIILRDSKKGDGDLLQAGLRFVPTSTYTNDDVMSGVKESTFNYWFDVMKPMPGTDQLAKYEWNVTASGREKLRAAGLSLEFPAVIRKQTQRNTTYYFAGEYVDFFRSMGPPDTRATLFINRSFYGRPVAGSTEFFYWSTAYPLISNILRRESNRMTGLPENVYIFDPGNNWWSNLFGYAQP
jgi:hypothetical protein